MKKKAFITGITGMDGSHLADLLLKKDYEVYGLSRAFSDESNIKHLKNKIDIFIGDIVQLEDLRSIISDISPDEVYNLAAQSSVGKSWSAPDYTFSTTCQAVIRMLDIIKSSGKDIKFFQAGSSEMFGNAGASHINESTNFHPNSPYATAKLAAYHSTKIYRDSHNLFAVNGILFNHESERRGQNFVTRKITSGVAKIKLGMEDSIVLGNLDVERDWGYAPDYVRAMWMMMQQESPDDYIVSTGTSHSLGYFLETAFKSVGIDNWASYVKQDPRYMRPSDIATLRGDSSKIKNNLGWRPEISFEAMVEKMVNNDLKLLLKA